MKAFMSMIFVTLFVFTGNEALAKNKIKRIDFYDVKKDSVAMAVETYDGEFFDLSEIKNVRKHRGNAEKLKQLGLMKMEDGSEIDVSAVRYFFVENGSKRRIPTFRKSGKTPFDEE